jgi:hypothetical protein
MRRYVRLGVACVVAAGVLVTVLYLERGGDAGAGPFQHITTQVIGSQGYVKGSVMWAATPPLQSNTSDSVYVAKITPVTSGCPVTYDSDALVDSSQSGYEEQGDFSPLQNGVHPIYNFSQIKIPRNSFYYGIVLFYLHRSCVLKLHGFKIHYRQSTGIGVEYLALSDSFYPLSSSVK